MLKYVAWLGLEREKTTNLINFKLLIKKLKVYFKCTLIQIGKWLVVTPKFQWTEFQWILCTCLHNNKVLKFQCHFHWPFKLKKGQAWFVFETSIDVCIPNITMFIGSTNQNLTNCNFSIRKACRNFMFFVHPVKKHKTKQL